MTNEEEVQKLEERKEKLLTEFTPKELESSSKLRLSLLQALRNVNKEIKRRKGYDVRFTSR